jgi:hypothetical protein
MSRPVRLVLAGVLVLLGLVWFFQGIGVLPGSFMSGEPVWAVIGGALVVLGASLALRARAPRG